MSTSTIYRVDLYSSERFIYEVEIEAPNVEAIRDNWDQFSKHLAREVYMSQSLEKKIADTEDGDQSQRLDAPNLEAGILPKLKGSDIQPVEGTAVQISNKELGYLDVKVHRYTEEKP